ncbi:MAG TPA: DUF2279 domain-containing protein [Bacteroidales bacterium]|nr:DUF2279 domain-containing protein [Bacteroidales bacterium]
MIKSRYLITTYILSLILSSVYAQKNEIKDSIFSVNNNTYKALGLTTAYYGASMYVLSKTWYRDKDLVSFHFYNDNSGYLQVDKFGHTWGSYVYSYIGYHYLINSGFSRKEALFYGATLGFTLQAPIEIMDGIHQGYGFSLGDIAANALGSGLVIGQELLFNEQIIKYKFSYWESSYAHDANGYLGETSLNRMLKDYNGHTYWFSFPVNKFFKSQFIPEWLNIAIGYGANGMFGEFENISSYKGVDIPKTIRYRQFLISLDIDWTKIKTSSKMLKIIFKGLTFVKLPFTTFEYNSMGKSKLYLIYY